MPIYTVEELKWMLRNYPEDAEIMITEPNPLLHTTNARRVEPPQFAYVHNNFSMRSMDVIVTENQLQNNDFPDDWDADRVKAECKKVLLF